MTEFASERTAKVLARHGAACRRSAERMIAAGRIAVNGKSKSSRVLKFRETDGLTVDGKALGIREQVRVWLYNKPRVVVTPTSNETGRQTVYVSLHDTLSFVASIGCLDIDSRELLLLTSYGGTKRLLELPSTGWVRKYRVRV